MKKKVSIIVTAVLVLTLMLSLVSCSARSNTADQMLTEESVSDSYGGTSTDNKAYSSEGSVGDKLGLTAEDYYQNDSDEYFSASRPQTDAGGVSTDAGDSTDEENAAMTNAELETAAALQNRKLIKSVDITAETLEFDKTLSELKKHINNCKGYIERSESSGNAYDQNSMRYANFEVRIPSDNLDKFTESIGALCNVTMKNEAVRDETASYVDTESHLKALRAEEESLLELLKTADRVDTIISLQSRLTNVIYQIESYESRLRTIDDLVSYSTVSLYIIEVEEETPVVVVEKSWGENMIDSFNEGLTRIGDSFKDFCVSFMGALPGIILVLIAVLAAVVIIAGIWKKSTKKTRAKKKSDKDKVIKSADTADKTAEKAEDNTEEKIE